MAASTEALEAVVAGRGPSEGQKPPKKLIVHPALLGKIVASISVEKLGAMFNLTRQQQLFLCVLLLLLLTGWAVKAWRTAHPPARSAISTAQ